MTKYCPKTQGACQLTGCFGNSCAMMSNVIRNDVAAAKVLPNDQNPERSASQMGCHEEQKLVSPQQNPKNLTNKSR
jgi:hypothetical protein